MRMIKMITISSGPDGVMHPDTIYPVEDKEAKALVDGGYATYETAMVKNTSPEKAGKSPDLNKIKDAADEKSEPETKPMWGKK